MPAAGAPETVSYTHLEEYTNYLNAAGTNYQLLQAPTKEELKLVEKYDTPKFIPGPVSYTHLDVYKRQPWPRPGDASACWMPTSGDSP